MGSVASVSLPPIITCPDYVPCTKDCYVVKNIYRYLPRAKKAYENNLKIWQNDPDSYFDQLRINVRHKKYPLFRYHVSGDIPSQDYYNRMLKLANECPETRFMVMTKNREIEFDDSPRGNKLKVLISIWPGIEVPRNLNYPMVFMQDGTEKRCGGAIQCGGGCDKCQACWDVKPGGKIVINKH